MTISPTTKPITSRTWFVMVILAITGQIAWAVENLWFNKFVYAVITPDPRPVAWMVAASAITATVTTLIMGTLSDRTRSRWGRRRPYILIGYVLWGISTALFPTVAYIKTSSIAIMMVVVLDSVMTFFGSTANDAAFNAWTADVASSEKRGRVEGVLNLCVFIAQIVAFAAAGLVIDSIGYFAFFYALGAIVLLAGLVGGLMLKEPVLLIDEKPRRSFWAEFADLFQFKLLKENRALFILLLFIMISSIGMQVSFPYFMVYLNYFLGVTNLEFTIIGGAVLVGSALLAIPVGILADKWNKKWIIAISLIISCIGGVILSLVSGLIWLAVAGFLWQAFAMASSVATIAWLKDLLPEESRGKFLGIRMIFWIAIPMVVGPAIGSALIRNSHHLEFIEGNLGYVPAPIVFQVGSAIAILALIPLLFIKKQQKLDAGKNS